jgi:predicted nucleic acid-binding protein
MERIRQQLANHSLIALDSAIFIYHFEAHPTYLPLTKIVLEMVFDGTCQAVISTVTLMELTVLPWRLGRANVARQYELLLVNFPHLTIVDVSRDVARRAAQLRALYRIRPADSLLVATGMVNQATAWVTNDKNLRRLAPDIEVFILDDWL